MTLKFLVRFRLVFPIKDIRVFHKEEYGALLETVSSEGNLIEESSSCRIVNPGHDIECSWFLLQTAMRRNDPELVKFAEQIFNEAFERGWDKEYGGLFYFKDLFGRPVEAYEHDMKLWRPVSSENAIALYAFAHAWRSYPDSAWKAACENILPFFLGLVDEKTGAVRNCDASSMDASQNNDPDLCDFVYTQGFALHAFLELYEAFGDGAMLARAEKLADWIVSVQCRGESPKWDGSWRGAISLSTGKWAGRCNQNNVILDEGGEFSAYTGWSAYPICMGLLRLVRCLENEKLKK